MKRVLLILSLIALSGCISQNDLDKGHVYTVSGPTPTGNSYYVCQHCYYVGYGDYKAIDCVDYATGMKVAEILNPSCIRLSTGEK